MKESKPAAKRRATAEDVMIGQKLRALRLDRGLSQSAAGARESDRGFAYLTSADAVRLVRAYAEIPERGPKAALVAVAEALAGGKRV